MKRFSSKQSRFFIRPICAAVLLAVAVQDVQANPTGASVINGQASFATSGNTLTVTNTPGAIINWQGFSIGANEITRFAQQSAASTVLNRVVSSNPSSILGSLQSNGRVFLVNPNGIIFGAGATVDVAGLVATTLNISNADFIAGRNNFTVVPGAQNISNAGSINAQSGGQIYLIAPNVENSGVITAPNGEILLAAGHSVELVDTTNPNLRVNITAPAGDATNVGQLIASSGSLGLFGTVVRNTGTVSADSATMQGGKIVFKASQRAEISGTVSADGVTGGTIQALGEQVGIMDGATLSANGTQGGGTILIGGDYQGKNPDVPNAQVTYVAPTATISADATGNGDGGKVIVWADDTTRYYGNITARGGVNGGNGGFVETSGHRYLDFQGRVDTLAPQGKVGTLLLDPSDITIDNTGPDTFAGGSFSGGWFSGATGNSTLLWSTVNTQLGLGGLEIRTNSAGTGGNGDININASTTLTAPNYLVLLANRNINFATGVAVNAIGEVDLIAGWNNTGWAVTPGTGNIAFGTGSSLSSSGGSIWFNAGNDVSLLSSSMLSAGGSGTITLLAANNILLGTSGSLVSAGGSILLNSDSNGAGGGGIYLDTGSSITSNGGNIIMGGGVTPSTGYAVGNGSVTGGITFNSGIYVLGNITAGAGNVTMHGEGAAINDADGIAFAGGLLSSNGIVAIDGKAHKYSSTTAGTAVEAGVDFLGAGTRLSTQTGTVTVTGLNDAPSVGGSYRAQGITVESGTIIETTGSGTLTLNGTSTSLDTAWGVGVFGGTIRSTAAGGGAITINGTNTTNVDGAIVIFTGGQVLSNGGAINMTGTSLAGAGIHIGGNVGGINSGNITITAPTNGAVIDITNAQIESGGNMTVNAGGDLTLTAGTSQALLKSGGAQTVNFTGAGAHTLALFGSNNNVAGASASIQSAGLQTITKAGTLAINLTGGSGTSNTLSATNGAVTTCTSCATFNDARIQSDGGQTINASTITIQGGSGGNGNHASIENKSTSVAQNITTTGLISITGGTGVGYFNSTVNDSVSNDASIHSDATQTINAGSIALIGGGDATTLGGAFLTGKLGQNITTAGNLTMTGGASNSTIDTQYGLGAPAIIGEEFGANITLNIGLALGMTGGGGSASGALIGSAQGTPVINITASTITMADGGGSSSRIGVLTGGPAGTLSMTASGAITQGASSYINTASLTAIVTAGALNLAGPNRINTLTSLSASGNVTYQSAQSFLASSVTSNTGSISLASSAGNISIGTLTAGANVTVDAYGAILDNNGSGVTNITTIGNIYLTSQYGGAAGGLAISTDVAADANYIFATVNSGSYSGIRVGIIGDLTSSTDIELDNTAATSGDIALNVTGNLTANDNIFVYTYGSALIGAGGTLTVDCCLDSNYGSLGLTASTININDSVSANTDLMLVAPTINLTGADVSAGGDIGIIAGNLNSTGSSIYANGDVVAVIANDIRLNNGSYIEAVNDVYLAFAGASSTLYLNDTAGMANASYILAAPTTTTLNFLARSSGGVVIDGVEKTSTAVGGSGFFAGSTSTPATLGAGLVINYSGASSVVNGLVNDVVSALSGIVLDTTDTTIGAEEKKKEEVVVVADGSAPPVEDTSTASLPVCK
jgi:filamentous hemagglutinin family protein